MKTVWHQRLDDVVFDVAINKECKPHIQRLNIGKVHASKRPHGHPIARLERHVALLRLAQVVEKQRNAVVSINLDRMEKVGFNFAHFTNTLITGQDIPKYSHNKRHPVTARVSNCECSFQEFINGCDICAKLTFDNIVLVNQHYYNSADEMVLMLLRGRCSKIYVVGMEFTKSRHVYFNGEVKYNIANDGVVWTTVKEESKDPIKYSHPNPEWLTKGFKCNYHGRTYGLKINELSVEHVCTHVWEITVDEIKFDQSVQDLFVRPTNNKFRLRIQQIARAKRLKPVLCQYAKCEGKFIDKKTNKERNCLRLHMSDIAKIYNIDGVKVCRHRVCSCQSCHDFIQICGCLEERKKANASPFSASEPIGVDRPTKPPLSVCDFKEEVKPIEEELVAVSGDKLSVKALEIEQHQAVTTPPLLAENFNFDLESLMMLPLAPQVDASASSGNVLERGAVKSRSARVSNTDSYTSPRLIDVHSDEDRDEKRVVLDDIWKLFDDEQPSEVSHRSDGIIDAFLSGDSSRGKQYPLNVDEIGNCVYHSIVPKNRVHDGQLKLEVLERRFLEVVKLSGQTKTIVYIGCSPGQHLANLVGDYSDFKFVCYDTRELKTVAVNVLFIKRQFTTIDAAFWSSRAHALICDVRDLSYESGERSKIQADQRGQWAWISQMKPLLFLTKFRPDVEPQLALGNEIWPQVYSRVDSLETRIFGRTIDGVVPKLEFNAHEVVGKIHYFNSYMREQPGFEHEYAESVDPRRKVLESKIDDFVADQEELKEEVANNSLNELPVIVRFSKEESPPVNNSTCDEESPELKEELETFLFVDIRGNEMYKHVVPCRQGFRALDPKVSQRTVADLRCLHFVESVDDIGEVPMAKYTYGSCHHQFMYSYGLHQKSVTLLTNRFSSVLRKSSTQSISYDSCLSAINMFITTDVRGIKGWASILKSDQEVFSLMYSDAERSGQVYVAHKNEQDAASMSKISSLPMAKANLANVMAANKHLINELLTASRWYAIMVKRDKCGDQDGVVVLDNREEMLLVAAAHCEKVDYTPQAYYLCQKAKFVIHTGIFNKCVAYTKPDEYIRLIEGIVDKADVIERKDPICAKHLFAYMSPTLLAVYYWRDKLKIILNKLFQVCRNNVGKLKWLLGLLFFLLGVGPKMYWTKVDLQYRRNARRAVFKEDPASLETNLPQSGRSGARRVRVLKGQLPH